MAKILAELIGTGMLLFLGCMGCVQGLGSDSLFKPFEISLSFGFTVMIVVQIFGCVSGAYINPAVTISAYIFGQISAIVRNF